MVEKSQVWKKRVYKPFSAFGFILVGIGIFWLLRDLGIIPMEVPIWPIIIIAAIGGVVVACIVIVIVIRKRKAK